MAAVDGRARELLARTEALGARSRCLGCTAPSASLRPIEGENGHDGAGTPRLTGRRLECVHVGPCEVRPGARVRLRPRGRADIMDLALAGRRPRSIRSSRTSRAASIWPSRWTTTPAGTSGRCVSRDTASSSSPKRWNRCDVISMFARLARCGAAERCCACGCQMGSPTYGPPAHPGRRHRQHLPGRRRLRRRGGPRLAQRPLPEQVRVVDFGIRGLDLTYALLDGYETVILVDAAPRGGRPARSTSWNRTAPRGRGRARRRR